MQSVRRCDSGELASPARLDNGFLLVEGRISRVGLQEYEDEDGLHMELRLPEEVFAPASMSSFHQMPVTDTHPPVLVTSENVRHYQRGNVGPVRKDGDVFLAAPLMISDAEAIKSVQAGRVELSCGYTCELDPTQHADLVAKWGPYKFIQRNIRGNHVALVDQARAGADARIKLDSGAARMIASRHPRPTPEPLNMPLTLRIDGLSLDATEANAPAIQQAIDRALATVKERGDAAALAEKTRADALAKKVSIVKDNAGGLLGLLGRWRKRWDAMKARTMSCDECSGTGKVGADGAKCDYCDGSGSFRMHDKVADLVEPAEDPDAAVDEEEVAEDADELEVEQATETEAQSAHKDRKRADAKKARADMAKRAHAARTASIARRVDRGIKARVALVDAARKHLPADTDFAKLDDMGVRKAVIVALCPGAKLDGKPAEAILARYDAELERAAEAPNGSDAARLGTGGPSAGGRNDAGDLPDPDAARTKMLDRNKGGTEAAKK